MKIPIKENFKSINICADYLVSNYGNVISLKNNKQTNLTKCEDGRGYYLVSIHINGKRKMEKIHRLVATAFIPNFKNKPEVNHKNGDKKDNYFENLEWVDRKENVNHYHFALAQKSERYKSLKNSVLYLRKTKSIKEISEYLGQTESTIKAITERNIS